MTPWKSLLLAASFASFLSACGGGGAEPLPPAPAAPAPAPVVNRELVQAVRDWNDAITVALDEGRPNANAELFVFPMASIAAHDALNAIQARYASYYAGATAQAGADPVAAVAKAVRDVLVATLPSTAASVDARYDATIATVPAGSARDLGVQVGAQAAARVLAERGTNVSVLGQPFAMTTRSQFRVAPPYGVAPGTPQADVRLGATRTSQYAADYNEVKCLGRAAGLVVAGCSVERNADQTDIALFWAEACLRGWNRIARGVAQMRDLDGWQLARALALTHIAVTDSQLASFDSKGTYDFWRPVNAIADGIDDENPATQPTPGWTPLRGTPPSPDYPSAHANGGDAGAAAMAAVFGDATPFSTTSGTLPNVTRSYTGFDQAAAENAVSRVYIGYHFRHATEVGRTQGRQVGEWAVANRLQPL